MTRKILTLFFGFLISLSHASDGLQRTDQDFYDDGVVLRKAGKLDLAKKCFSAAVFTEDKMLAVRALYNLGYISYLQGRIWDTVFWLERSNSAHITLKHIDFPPAVKGSKILLAKYPEGTCGVAKEAFPVPNKGIRDSFSQVTFSSDPRAISLEPSA